MPYFSASFSQGQPIIDVIIGISAARMSALDSLGLTPPTAQSVRALVDTGASHTCIDPSVFSALELSATGTVPMHTPSTAGVAAIADTFDVGLAIPGKLEGLEDALMIPYLQVSACELFGTQSFHVLLGRDVLSRCLLTYDGIRSVLTVAY